MSSSKKRKARERRRPSYRPLLERLEDRTLLSGAHDIELLAGLPGALGAGSESLAAWGDRLAAPSILGSELPLLGTQLGHRVRPGGTIASLVAPLAPQFGSLADLRTGLSGLAGVTVAAARDQADRLELDVRFQKDVTF